jgi:hypothetical protein
MSRFATFLLLATLPAIAQEPDPITPAAHHVIDQKYGLTLQIPAAWNLSRHDGELSTFHADARSAPTLSQLRAVASIAFNPYPLSNFAGALVYLSVTPHTNDADCARQAFLPLHHPATTAQINGISFSRGHDEHGDRFCIESRDDVYTTFRRNACTRVDLVVNTFCAKTSGAQELTVRQMDDLQSREHKILDSLTLKP